MDHKKLKLITYCVCYYPDVSRDSHMAFATSFSAILPKEILFPLGSYVVMLLVMATACVIQDLQAVARTLALDNAYVSLVSRETSFVFAPLCSALLLCMV